MLVWFLPLFLFFLMIGLPVFFGLLAAPGIVLWLNGQERDLALLYRNVYNGMDSFPLMAIPFFMLAGELMNRGGITMRLVEFSQSIHRRSVRCWYRRWKRTATQSDLPPPSRLPPR
jgi:TRAP-type mannitol/chloroaromatic compound transport system permease large subunit